MTYLVVTNKFNESCSIGKNVEHVEQNQFHNSFPLCHNSSIGLANIHSRFFFLSMAMPRTFLRGTYVHVFVNMRDSVRLSCLNTQVKLQKLYFWMGSKHQHQLCYSPLALLFVGLLIFILTKALQRNLASTTLPKGKYSTLWIKNNLIFSVCSMYSCLRDYVHPSLLQLLEFSLIRLGKQGPLLFMN